MASSDQASDRFAGAATSVADFENSPQPAQLSEATRRQKASCEKATGLQHRFPTPEGPERETLVGLSPSPDPPAAPLLRVMLVDDATDALRIMCHLLTALGCKVLDLNEPQACSRKASYFRPELVLLDLSMPGMDGFAVARELRGLDIPSFCLAAITGRGDDDTRSRCEQEGFDYFLLKPAKVTEIEQLLQFASQHKSRA